MDNESQFAGIVDEWERHLNQSGYRLTQPRRAILRVIATSTRPLTPVEIYDQVRALSPSIGLVTVYRTIDRLAEMSLIERVHQSDNCQTIFRGTQEHRHLLVCGQCGESVYFDGLEIEHQFSEIGHAHGYQVTHHWLQLEGLCQSCQAKHNKIS
jgi:Fe2+ or Zn2+ uptake regulation protein